MTNRFVRFRSIGNFLYVRGLIPAGNKTAADNFGAASFPNKFETFAPDYRVFREASTGKYKFTGHLSSKSRG
jgi:hypothetical protein